MDERPPLLYLVHRIPYPPNKGDKLRSFHILRQLARNYRVYLGTFVDIADDMAHVETLHHWCEDVCAVRLHPTVARLLSLRGLLGGEALSLPYYRSTRLRAWVRETVGSRGIDKAVTFSSPMAQYLLDVPGLRRRVVDFCDLDSAKWTQYASARRWPMSWLYRREGERLLHFERSAARAADASIFVTDAEAGLFRRHAPSLAGRVLTVGNGVDADFFSPDLSHANPYPDGGPLLVFTGAMDYWPNVEAVGWFVREILPALRRRHPGLRFYIVGMNPAPAVQALAAEDVVVTGTVEDIRPWLAHADVVVAPLRIARGIQNKVLEAMAMGRPVVVSWASVTGLAARDGVECHAAASAEDFILAIGALLSDESRRARMGAAARARVLEAYCWQAHLCRFDALLAEPSALAANDIELVRGTAS